MSLLQRARSEDQVAWQQLVTLYGPLVQRWCTQAGMQRDDVSDVFQETFRAVAGGLAGFSPARNVGSFRCWLKTITRTKIADHFRRLNNAPSGRGGTEAQLHLARVADPVADDSNDEASEESAFIVQRAMDMIKSEFSPQNWAAFERVALQGEGAADVARELGLGPQAVRQANYRIRRRLRTVLMDLEDA